MELDVPPPGAGFVTAVGAVPTAVSEVAAIVAVRVVPPFETVLATVTPLNVSVEPVTNPEPFAVITKAELIGALAGVSEPRTGTGLLAVKFTEFEEPPPGVGFATVTPMAPGLFTALAGMFAVMSWPLLETAAATVAPPKCMVAPNKKFVPDAVNSEIAAPTEPEFGLIEVICGAGLFPVITCASAEEVLTAKLTSPP